MTENTHPRIITPMSDEMLAAIDDYRFSTRQPSRASAIRSLLDYALNALGHGGAEPPQPPAKAKTRKGTT